MLVPASIPPPGKEVYSLDDIKDMEQEYRTHFPDPEDKKLTAWFFFADAGYAENEGDSKVLGIAYAPLNIDYQSIAMDKKSLKNFSGGVIS